MRHTISYVSTSQPFLTDDDIQSLFKSTSLYNNINDVTGILLHSRGNFFQVLEGQKDIIQGLFKKIKLDSRHHDVIKILDRSIEDITFSNYYSSFTTISDKSSYNDLIHFLEKEKSYNPEGFENIAYIINKFMKFT